MYGPINYIIHIINGMNINNMLIEQQQQQQVEYGGVLLFI